MCRVYEECSGRARAILKGQEADYQLAYKLAMEIFVDSKTFPLAERFSLTDQIRRALRSVAANIAEGYRKKQYPKMFVSKMADADGEATETQVWLEFARDCGYLSPGRQQELTSDMKRPAKCWVE